MKSHFLFLAVFSIFLSHLAHGAASSSSGAPYVFTASTPDAIESHKTPKNGLFIQYKGPLSADVEGVCQQAAKAIGASDITFYKTDFSCPLAFSCDYNTVGLDRFSLKKAQDARYTPLNTAAIKFKNKLYHEICHIKCKHTSKTLEFIKTCEDEESQKSFKLHQEMEAELGAIFYMFKLDGIINKKFFTARSHYYDTRPDKHHPSEADHEIYIALLYKELLKNPDADFSIVTHLAQIYHEQLTSKKPHLNWDQRKTLKKNLITKINTMRSAVKQHFIELLETVLTKASCDPFNAIPPKATCDVFTVIQDGNDIAPYYIAELLKYAAQNIPMEKLQDSAKVQQKMMPTLHTLADQYVQEIFDGIKQIDQRAYNAYRLTQTMYKYLSPITYSDDPALFVPTKEEFVRYKDRLKVKKEKDPKTPSWIHEMQVAGAYYLEKLAT